MMKACIFLDGENFRHSLTKLFPESFNPLDYLPKDADWTGFFDWVAEESMREAGMHNGRRLRTYWYVVEEIDTWPPVISGKHFDRNTFERRHKKDLEQLVVRTGDFEDSIDELLMRKQSIINRFDGWHTFQRGIVNRHNRIEFRRSGSITYNLFYKTFGHEKTVDVHMALDMVKLAGIYDVCVIMSGDQDYTPAAEAAKDMGKLVCNVSFATREHGYLTNVTRRLNEVADWNFTVPFEQMCKFMQMEEG